MNKKDHKIVLGNCFTTAYQAGEKFNKVYPYVCVCHGIVLGAPGSEIEDVKYVHAWLEINQGNHTICYDGETKLFVDQQMYYKFGRVQEVYKYMFSGAYIELHGHGHYGPWEKKLLGMNQELIDKYKSEEQDKK